MEPNSASSGSQSQPTAADANDQGDDHELEEGEIADDSNDGCTPSDDDDENAPDNLKGPNNSVKSTSLLGSCGFSILGSGTLGGGGASVLPTNEDGPQKKRKKVVRKVRKKIKVKKKIIRKKGSQAGGSTATSNVSTGGGNNANNNNATCNNDASGGLTADGGASGFLDNSNANRNRNYNTNDAKMINVPPSVNPSINLSNFSSGNGNPQQPRLLPPPTNTANQPPLLPQQPLDASNFLQRQMNFTGGQSMLPIGANSVAGQQSLQPQSTQPLDSLWEQQILMLQELQRQQQQTDQQHSHILRAAATDEDLRIFPPVMVSQQPHLQQLQILQQQQYQSNLSLQQFQPTAQQQTITTIAPSQAQQQGQQPNPNPQTTSPLRSESGAPANQTPSSPDDENGKSSYEAISKMLTLLRNSANIAENSESNSIDNDIQRQANDTDMAQSPKSKDFIEYKLVPIIVEGIDYTKYKLLSQYEPKFKNDPRLNQQA